MLYLYLYYIVLYLHRHLHRRSSIFRTFSMIIYHFNQRVEEEGHACRLDRSSEERAGVSGFLLLLSLGFAILNWSSSGVFFCWERYPLLLRLVDIDGRTLWSGSGSGSGSCYSVWSFSESCFLIYFSMYRDQELYYWCKQQCLIRYGKHAGHGLF